MCFNTPEKRSFWLKLLIFCKVCAYQGLIFFFLPFFADPDLESVEKSRGIRSKRKTDRLTAYACEDTTLNITCGQDLYLGKII